MLFFMLLRKLEDDGKDMGSVMERHRTVVLYAIAGRQYRVCYDHNARATSIRRCGHWRIYRRP